MIGFIVSIKKIIPLNTSNADHLDEQHLRRGLVDDGNYLPTHKLLDFLQ
jgi:hypothetical protein